MDNSAQIYKQKVWEFLDNMEANDSYAISDICIPENREKFIACIKTYMDAHLWQGWLSFNREYTRIYKTSEIIFKT